MAFASMDEAFDQMNASRGEAERRRGVRLDSRLPIQFVSEAGDFLLRTDNISQSGLFIASQHLLTRGERFFGILHLPVAEPPVRFEAEVVRAEEGMTGRLPGLGVRFVSVERGGWQRIRDYSVARVMGQVGVLVQEGEHRHHARIKPRLRLRYRIDADWLSGRCQNVSSGGMFLRTRDHHEVSTPLELYLQEPASRRCLRLNGQVVRQGRGESGAAYHRRGFGVRFGKMGPERRWALRDLLCTFVLTGCSPTH